MGGKQHAHTEQRGRGGCCSAPGDRRGPSGPDPAAPTQARGGEVRGHTKPHPVPAHRTCPALPPRPTHLAQRIHTGVHEAGPQQFPQCSGGMLFPEAPHSARDRTRVPDTRATFDCPTQLCATTCPGGLNM